MPRVYSPPERRRTDRIYARTLSPRELEALQLIEGHPGITVEELAETMGVGIKRVWQYLNSLEFGYVPLDARKPGAPPAAAAPAAECRGGRARRAGAGVR
jgi:DNA-binding CsgD family transcriptional regulator